MKPDWVGNRWFFVGLGVAALFLMLCIVLYPLMRPLRDDWVLDGEVQAVAMDWRDFGPEKASERLEWALTHRDLGASVRTEDCKFEHAEDASQVVRCNWKTDVVWPVVGWMAPLEFQSVAAINHNGELTTP